MSRNGVIRNDIRYDLDELPIKLRATYSCDYWPDDGVDYPVHWHGWCDPHNPWGSANSWPRTYDDPEFVEGDEPIEVVLPLAEAVEFIAEFPGGVWDLCEGEHSQDYRTGVYTEVTLHVADWDDPYRNLVLERAEREMAQRDARLRRQIERMRRK